MLKVVFFLVLGAFVIGAALGVLVMALQVIGYVLAYLFKFLAWLFRKLELAYVWVRLRSRAWSRMKVSPEPELASSEPEATKDVPMSPESTVAPLCEANEPASADNVASSPAEPATEVSHDPLPVEADAARPKSEEKPAAPSLPVSLGESEGEVAPDFPQAVRQEMYPTKPLPNPAPNNADHPLEAAQPALPVSIGNEHLKDAKRSEAKPEGWGVVPSDELPPAVGRASKSQKPLAESQTNLRITLNKTPGSLGDLVELFVKGRPVDGYGGKLLVSWVMHDWSAGSYVIGPNTGSGRYSLGTDTKYVNYARFWYQVDLVTA